MVICCSRYKDKIHILPIQSCLKAKIRLQKSHIMSMSGKGSRPKKVVLLYDLRKKAARKHYYVHSVVCLRVSLLIVILYPVTARLLQVPISGCATR